jgi:hypothetical protein
MYVDSGVEEEGVGGTEVVDPSGNAAGVGAGEMGGIGVDAEEHVRGANDKGGIGEGGGVAEKAIHFGNGGGGGFRLEGGEGGDSREHAVVYGTGVVQERPNNLLEGLSFSGGCGGGSIGGGDLGGGGTVYNPFVNEGGAGVADAVGADGL